MISINDPHNVVPGRWTVPYGPFSLLTLGLLLLVLPGWVFYSSSVKGWDGLAYLLLGVPICCGLALLSALVGCLRKEAGRGWAALLAVAVPLTPVILVSL